MNKIQLFGAVLVIIGFAILIVFPIIGIVVGELLILASVVGGWIIILIGALILIVSLIFERMKDVKKETFSKDF